MNDNSQKPFFHRLDITGKIALFSLILSGINVLILLSFIPTMTKAGNVVNQIETSIKQTKNFFGGN